MTHIEFVPHEVVHRAASALADDQRRYEVWQSEFERTYNVRMGVMTPGLDKYIMFFRNEQDYMMFMLRWQ